MTGPQAEKCSLLSIGYLVTAVVDFAVLVFFAVPYAQTGRLTRQARSNPAPRHRPSPALRSARTIMVA